MTKNYLCIQRSPEGNAASNAADETGGEAKCGAAPSPAQMQEMYAQFNAWKAKFEDKIIDMGGKLGDGAVVTSSRTTDGPFVETKEIVGGYMIVRAESMEEAAEIARESPGVAMPGSSVEVREISTP